MRGEPAAPRQANEPWHPVQGSGAPLADHERGLAGGAVDGRAHTGGAAMTLLDVVDVALANNPQTHESWARAQVASAALGSARGAFLPTLTIDATASPSKVISANPARLPATRTTQNVSAALSYLVFDFGGRSGLIGAAREAVYAADFAHNATLQNVALAAQLAAFQYQTARGLLEAARASVKTAEVNQSAAERRHDVGLATIADVLQAKTAVAQARLAVQDADANVEASRASLAAVLGLQPTAPFELAPDTTAPHPGVVSASVDSLIAQAERDRPDLAASRAEVRAALAEVRSVTSAVYPSLTLGAARGYAFSSTPALEGNTYSLTFGVSIPVFSGFSRQYESAAARHAASAAAARAQQARLTAGAQVYATYHALRTASQRVATSEELLASATQSEEVARARYSEGVGSILDLLSAQNALADARAQAVQARWTWSALLAQLAHDVGALGPRGEPNLRLSPAPAGGSPR